MTSKPAFHRNEASRYRTYEVNITNTAAPYNFVSKLDQTLTKVVKVELIEARITGVPVTGSNPDHEYYQLSLKEIGVDAVSDNGRGNRIRLFLDGARTHRTFTDRLLCNREQPMDLHQLSVVLHYPSNIVVGSSDVTGLYLTLRVYQDTWLPGLV